MFDVIIIGGGVIGCACAYYLSLKGFRVLVLEKEAIGSQASSGAVGLFSIDSKPFSHRALREAAIWSRAAYGLLSQGFKRLYGNDLELENCGILRAARNQSDLEAIRKEASWHKRHVADIEELTAGEIYKQWPEIKGGIVGGVFYPQDTQATSSRIVAAFYQAAQDHGVVFKENAEVVGFETTGSAMLSVQTKNVSYKAKNFLLAAGSWTSILGEKLRVNLPIEPVRGQLLIFQMANRFLSCPVTIGGSEYYYLVPKQDGHLYAGTTLERAGFNTNTTEEALDRIASEVTDLAPKVSELPVRGSWAGLRPATADELPILGLLPSFKNLWVASGHHRKGILLAPWTGKTMAELLSGEKPEILMESFSPSRFIRHKVVT